MESKIIIHLNEAEKIKEFIRVVTGFQSDIDIISGCYVCDAKSLLAIFSYDLSKRIEVELHSSDETEIQMFYEAMEAFQ